MGNFDELVAVAKQVPLIPEKMNTPALALNEAVVSTAVVPDIDQTVSIVETGPVLIVPVILALLALVAVSRRKQADK